MSDTENLNSNLLKNSDANSGNWKGSDEDNSAGRSNSMTGMCLPGINPKQSDIAHDGDENLSFSSALEAQIDEESPNFGKFDNNSFVSTWTKDKADEYDYCMVLPLNENGDLNKKSIGYINTLKKVGLDLFIYKGFQAEGKKTEAYVLIKATKANLKSFAEKINFRFELDPARTREVLEAGDAEQGIEPIKIPHVKEIVQYEPWVYIYARYTDTVDPSIYWVPKNSEDCFRDIARLKLTALLAESRPPNGGQPIKIKKYILQGTFLGFFPLHNRSLTDGIARKWYNWRSYPWNAPFYQIKEYFGEKVCLYYVFMGHYTKWLIFPALIGIPFQIAVFAQNDFSAPYLPAVSFLVSLWAIVMLEFWKRKEKKYALEWGTLDFEKAEQDRPDFKGEDIDSFVHGGKIKYFPPAQRAIYQTQSGIIIFVMVCLVIGVVASIYVIKYSIEGDDCESKQANNAQTIASILNAVLIQLMNFLYGTLAKALCTRENHRTDTAYEDSMITKLFCFQFVNSYASFFYLAFVQASIPDSCGAVGKGDATMRALAINLAIVFGTRIASGNISELLIPYLTYQIKYGTTWLTSGKLFTSDVMSRPEKEYLLVPYEVMSTTLDDYAEVAIQFGYNGLFLSSLPLASLFGLIANWIEFKGDAWKIMNLHQRPVPAGAEDIGTWQTIFLVLSVVSVITNAGLICFTMDTFDAKERILNGISNESLRLWVFIGFQWILFSLQALLMGAIPDVPEEILIQKERQDFIVSKVIDKIADDKINALEIENIEVKFQEYPKGGGMYKGNENMFLENMK